MQINHESCILFYFLRFRVITSLCNILYYMYRCLSTDWWFYIQHTNLRTSYAHLCLKGKTIKWILHCVTNFTFLFQIVHFHFVLIRFWVRACQMLYTLIFRTCYNIDSTIQICKQKKWEKKRKEIIIRFQVSALMRFTWCLQCEIFLFTPLPVWWPNENHPNRGIQFVFLFIACHRSLFSVLCSYGPNSISLLKMESCMKCRRQPE